MPHTWPQQHITQMATAASTQGKTRVLLLQRSVPHVWPKMSFNIIIT